MALLAAASSIGSTADAPVTVETFKGVKVTVDSKYEGLPNVTLGDFVCDKPTKCHGTIYINNTLAAKSDKKPVKEKKLVKDAGFAFDKIVSKGSLKNVRILQKQNVTVNITATIQTGTQNVTREQCTEAPNSTDGSFVCKELRNVTTIEPMFGQQIHEATTIQYLDIERNDNSIVLEPGMNEFVVEATIDGLSDNYFIVNISSPYFTAEVDPSFTTGWERRKNITIDHTHINETLTNFPVFLNLSDANLTTHAQPDGDDIAFTDVNGTTIYHEIENFTSSTGWLTAWVKIPVLSNNTDTKIIMYWNNSAAQNQQNATEVWDNNYKGVWHLSNGDNNESAQFYKDSTKRGANATLNDTNGDVAQRGGIAGYALHFNASSNDLLSTETRASLSGTTDFTVGGWVKTGSTATMRIIGQRGPVTVSGQYYLDTKNDGSGKIWGNAWNGAYQCSGGNVESAATINNNAWHYVLLTRDGTGGMKVWVDGVQSGSCSGTTRSLEPAMHTVIAYDIWDNIERFNGTMDEFRVSNVTRTAAWIKAEYNNTKVPKDFYSVGTEEATPPAQGGAAGSCSPVSGGRWELNLTDACILTGLNINITEWQINATNGGTVIVTNSNITYINRTIGSVAGEGILIFGYDAVFYRRPF